MIVRAIFAALVYGITAMCGAWAEEVDVELVLAVDVSRSIDEEEFKLQRQGYADAFLHPAVIQAIQGGKHGRIAVAYVEWAGVEFQKLVVPWTVIKDRESGALLSEAILREQRSFYGRTSISGAIDFSMQVLAQSPHTGIRRVIDVSGDGVNNSGRPAKAARDQAAAANVTINGLVIMNDRLNLGLSPTFDIPLDEFYRENVICGLGAFVISADDFSSFAYAIKNKLIREVAEQMPALGDEERVRWSHAAR